MVNFMKLVQNENMKIYRRARTWVMLGIILVLPVLLSMLLYFASNSDETITGFSAMQLDGFLLTFLITIFSVVLAAEAVAGEFTWGTIKLLLIRPWSRSSILLSKFIAVVLFSLLITAIGFLVTFLINMAFFGATNDINEYIPELNAGAGVLFNELGHLFWLNYVTTLVIIAFAFMLSSALRSNGLAIGLSISIVFTAQLWSHLFLMIDKPWIKYVLFLHLDLTQYANGRGGPIADDPLTLGFAISVLAVYFVLFNLISWTVFRKRDVAA
ncbi:ABC transporter permease [Cohnella yongneupensis]|uniref:ABC transporter permease n=1 Tax=Cohnella yongneupensis TaxID=425006 RepID=A0ABW0R078_9BACL